MLRVGIVGLPNVGKSTLFNALTKQQVEAKNFPFTTIDPNVGVVAVPDERLEKLAALSKSEKIVPTTIEFVDIAGLVQGAHKGEGLGNQFLSHIRQVNAIAHVVRFFENGDVMHVANKVDPIADVATIDTELALADLATVEQVIPRAKDAAKSAQMKQTGADKNAIPRLAVIEKLHRHLSDGNSARTLGLDDKEKELIADLHLLTSKPVLYVANVDEEQIKNIEKTTAAFSQIYSPVLPLSIKVEQELIELDQEERQTFLDAYGLKDTGLNRLIKESYALLNLITFLTTGPKETRAWTIQRGANAPQAAGEIHSDFERGFIRAETVAYTDLINANSYATARSAGKVRDEGKTYIVKDGDVMIFKFSV